MAAAAAACSAASDCACPTCTSLSMMSLSTPMSAGYSVATPCTASSVTQRKAGEQRR